MRVVILVYFSAPRDMVLLTALLCGVRLLWGRLMCCFENKVHQELATIVIIPELPYNNQKDWYSHILLISIRFSPSTGTCPEHT